MKIAFLLAILAAGLAAQSVVEGRLIDSVTGAPVSGAYVTGGNTQRRSPPTDSSGRFPLIPSNNQAYVYVKRNGYVDHRQGFVFAPGQLPAEVRVALVPQAVISGRVLDENGLPVRGAWMRGLQFATDGEIRTIAGGAQTNERGEYRLFGLAPGRYYVSLTPEKLAEWDPRYSARFYPGETEIDRAEPIDVHAGEERGGRDFRLTRQEGVTLSGRLVRPANAQQKPVRVFLQATGFSDHYVLPTGQNGDAFTFTHIPPGNYKLQTWTYTLQPRIGDMMGEMTVKVGKADMRDLHLNISPIVEHDVAGKIVFLGKTKPGQMAVTLRRELGDAKSTLSETDGSFVIEGVLPGKYFMDVRSAAPAGAPQSDGDPISWQFGGRDVLWQRFDIGNASPGEMKIAVAAPVAKLTGKLLDAAGQPVSGGGIMLQSANGDFSSQGYVDQDGNVTVSVRIAGTYRIFVVPASEETGSFRDAYFLQTHQNDFAPLQISEGANPPLMLRLPAQ